MFKKIFHPFLFQGNMNKNKYFEGWYYKFVTSDINYSIAVIPGISLNKTDSHTFIQVFITQNNNDKSIKTEYFRFPKSSFLYNSKQQVLRISNNTFSKEYIKLELNSDHISLNGTISFKQLTPIKSSLLQPSIMGFFGYMRFLECNHGVVSMSHKLQGSLMFNQKTIDFEEGLGYMEKDWGRSFPQQYVWMQSNHFKQAGTSLMFSHATIPFIGFTFKGLIANLIYDGKEYRFATYNGAKIKERIMEDKHVFYRIKKGRLQLLIEAWNDEIVDLPSPKNGQMLQSIKEGLSGKIHIELIENKTLIYKDTGYYAGLEIMWKI